jgi:hypothetical protein
MKQYVIDELRPADYRKLKEYLEEHFGNSFMEGIYWIPLDETLWTDTQRQHTDCQPFYLALELQPERLACELLVRTRQRVRCQCIGYATEFQRKWIMDSIDAIFEKLEIKT